MLRIELTVDRATNGFIVYESDGAATIHSDLDSAVADIQKRCKDRAFKWFNLPQQQEGPPLR